MNNNPWGSSNDSWGSMNSSPQPDSTHSYSTGRDNSLLRSAPNWISLGIALVFILCYLFLPFVKVMALLPLTGMTMMANVNAIMCLPIVAGVLMILGALLFNEKISAIIGGVSAVLVLVLLLCSNSIMLGANLSNIVGDLAQQYIGYNISGLLAPRAGLGCIFCLALAIIFVLVELLMANGMRRPSRHISENPWTNL